MVIMMVELVIRIFKIVNQLDSQDKVACTYYIINFCQVLDPKIIIDLSPPPQVVRFEPKPSLMKVLLIPEENIMRHSSSNL